MEIRPAYDPEDWPDPTTDRLSEADAHWENAHGECMGRHQAAARALLDQPFGFTWEMVDAIRECARVMSEECGWDGGDAKADSADQAADRIASILPPREP